MAKTNEELIHDLASALMVDPSRPEQDTLRAAIRRANDHERLIADVSASAGMNDYGPAQDTIDAVRALRSERDELRDTVACLANNHRRLIEQLRREMFGFMNAEYLRSLDDAGVIDAVSRCCVLAESICEAFGMGNVTSPKFLWHRVENQIEASRAAVDALTAASSSLRALRDATPVAVVPF